MFPKPKKPAFTTPLAKVNTRQFLEGTVFRTEARLPRLAATVQKVKTVLRTQSERRHPL